MPSSCRLLGIAFLAASPLLQAGSFSFQGAFAFDTDLQYFTFTLLKPTANVSLRTWSYAGGEDAAGQTVASGGFEPLLNLYGPGGIQMNPGVSGPCGGSLAQDPVTGVCGDVYYPTTLSFPGGLWSPGDYTLVLSTVSNPGIGDLSDGFFADQVLQLPIPSNFSCQQSPTISGDQPFCDSFNPDIERSGAWELDIVNVDSAGAQLSTPEPGTLGMSFLSLALAIAFVLARVPEKLKSRAGGSTRWCGAILLRE